MTARTTTRLAWAFWSVSVGLLVATSIAQVVHPLGSAEQGSPADGIIAALLIGGFATVGALIGWKQPSNPIGWLMSATGLCYAAGATFIALQGFRATAGVSNWFGWIWLFGIGLVAFVLLLFPTGSVASPRWRIVGWIEGIGIAAWVTGNLFAPTIFTAGQPSPPNPIGVPAPAGNLFPVLAVLGVLAIVEAGLAGIVSLFVRYRRAGSVEREQLKWLLFAGLIIVLGLVAQFVVPGVMGSTTSSTNLVNAISTGTIASVPIAIGIAVFRYRLYDIDIVINRTVVYVALAAFITGVYVAIVVGIGSLVGRTDQPNVALSIVATAVVAVAFQPVRERVQRVANRLVYGRRATPYEALSRFADEIGTTDAAEDVLPRVARALAEATGAVRTEVWLRFGPSLRREASFPDGAAAPGPPSADVPMGSGQETLPPLPGATAAFEVRHRGELLGALALAKRPGESLTPTERALASRLASQAGLALRNAGLTDELKARLVELRESRQRVVATADEERRRLERNIHDGAQQQLVALAVKVKLADALVARDSVKARDLVEQLRSEAGDALENLRDLASGIYPPVLTEQGVAAALEAQARTSPIPVVVSADGFGRYPQEQEAALYFSALEALQNVAKYASASRATVRLADRDGHAEFSVADDGEGFDTSATGYGTGLRGIADRLGSVDGELVVRSAPGQGTTVVGRVPVRSLEVVT
jgi:signal transduction histidine kinase